MSVAAQEESDWQRAAPVRAAQRRAVPTLFATQVVGGIAIGAGAAVSSLLAYEVTASESMAGISRIVSAGSVAVLAGPLAVLAVRFGRRPALTLGWLGAAAGGVMLAVAAGVRSLPLLLVGMFVYGAGNAANLQARFAAADLATPRRRASSLSFVLWGTTVGSIVGPNLVGVGALLAHRLAVPEIAGVYLIAAAGSVVAAAMIAGLLRPDPMRVAQEHGAAPQRAARRGASTALRLIWSLPAARFALVTVVLNQMVMTSIMTLTPVHMKAIGHSLAAVGFTLSLHITGMFALSPVVGWLVDRAGAKAMIWVCVAVHLVATGLCFASHGDVALLDLALFLLGLGWSFGMIAGSSLLLDAVPASVRTQAQGASDAVMNVGAALAAGLAGVVLAAVGYQGLSVAGAALLLPIAALALATRTPAAR